VNTPRPDRRAADLPARAMRALTEAAELHERPIQVLQPAMTQAAHIVMALVSGAGDGRHEVHILVPHADGDLEYTLAYARSGRTIAFPEDGTEQTVVMLLAIANLTGRPGTMTLKSRPHAAGLDPHQSTLRGWRLRDQSVQPMTDGELIAFTTTRGDEPAAPESGARFRTAFPIDPDYCPVVCL
jgi:hypothetical protein